MKVFSITWNGFKQSAYSLGAMASISKGEKGWLFIVTIEAVVGIVDITFGKQ